MKRETISEVINNIDSKYIEEAAEYGVKGNKKKTFNRGLIAACVAFVAIAICAAVLLPHYLQDIRNPSNQNGNIVSYSTEDRRWPVKYVVNEESNSETVIIKQWEDMTVCEQYFEVLFNGVGYSSRRTELSTESVGVLLGNYVACGIDQINDIKYEKTVECYTISKISEECAVAVKFANDEKYYVYVNSYYRPETLGDLIRVLNLAENIKFNSAWYTYTIGKELVNVNFLDIYNSTVWDRLYEHRGVDVVPEDDKNFSYDMTVSIDIPILGYNNISLSVSKEGYIMTNILDSAKRFSIGTEAANEFIRDITENCEGYEIIYVSKEYAEKNNIRVTEVTPAVYVVE